MRTKLDNEKNFLINLHKFVRERAVERRGDIKMTNDPSALYKAFSDEPQKSNFGLAQRDPQLVKNMIENFYSHKPYFERVKLAFDLRNKLAS